ncbi:MAG: choice-of-anchor J domain-containing protein [Prevotella sp.]|nr:choice-of-anchor J domain-containing protein [Prevotella sp.]
MYKKIFFGAFLAMAGGTCCAQSIAEVRADYERQHPAALSVSPNAVPTQKAAKKISEVVALPFFETFDTDLGLFTTLNANGDAYTWEWNDSQLAGNQGAAHISAIHAAADDWLFTPGLRMQADRTYTLSFQAWCSAYGYYVQPELMEVKAGMAPTAADMTEMMVDETTVEWSMADQRSHFSVVFHPQADGIYYFGWHGMSPTNSWSLFVDNVAVEQESMLTAPKAVDNLEAEAGEEGRLEATVSFTLPTEAINGDKLELLTLVELYRGDALVNSWTDQQPGAQLSFTDTGAQQGNNVYLVKVYNAEGDAGLGKQAVTSVFCGIDVPQRVRAVLSDDGHTLTATWQPVGTEGKNGHYVDPSKVCYGIYEVMTNDEGYSWAQIIDTTAVGATSYDFGINPDEGQQSNAWYAIAAINEMGSSGIYSFDNVLVKGRPYTLPFNETFARMQGNGSFYEVKYRADSTPDPYIADVSHDDDATSGSLVWKPRGEDALYFYTGKLTVANAVNPTLTYAVRGLAGGLNSLNVVAIRQGGEEVELPSVNFVAEEGNDTVWVVKTIDLSELKDARYFRLLFKYESLDGESGTIALDDIHVFDNIDHNMLVRVRCQQASVMPGQSAGIVASVLNAGQKPASDYVVVIAVDGADLLREQLDETLQPGQNHNFFADYATDIFTELGNKQIMAMVIYRDDENQADNIDMVELQVVEPDVNPVTDLQLDGNNLSWQTPERKVETITDDFEAYTPWTVDGLFDDGTDGAWGGWTAINNDEAYAGGLFRNTQLPHQDEKYAFLLVNFETTYGAGEDYPGRSGYQYLSSFVGMNALGTDFAPLDNWLVSPELPGMAQDITFFVNNVSTEDEAWPVTFSVMASSTGKEMSDFQQVGDAYVHNVGSQYWIRYNAQLPEGTKYFAIRQTEEAGQSRWMGIDEITYTAYGSPVASYNIYVDGVKVANVAKDQLTYALDGIGGKHAISVTAVYENGIESLPVTVSGVLGITEMVLNQLAPQNVYTPTGVCVRRNATSTAGLKPGVYVVGGRKFVVE